jgi:hypothetical protein
VERAGAKQASLPTNEHYAQIEELLPSFKAYTSKMSRNGSLTNPF